MHQLRRYTDQALEAQRHQAQQAARQPAEWQRACWENTLERMGELALAGYLAESKRMHEREVGR